MRGLCGGFVAVMAGVDDEGLLGLVAKCLAEVDLEGMERDAREAEGLRRRVKELEEEVRRLEERADTMIGMI